MKCANLSIFLVLSELDKLHGNENCRLLTLWQPVMEYLMETVVMLVQNQISHPISLNLTYSTLAEKRRKCISAE